MRQRGYRGWATATTIAVTLTLVFLSIDKHLREERLAKQNELREVAPAVADIPSESEPEHGIVLSTTPSVDLELELPIQETAIERISAAQEQVDTHELLRRPPEPVANVVLFTPVAPQQFELSSKSSTESSIQVLMESLDEALDTPMQVTSAKSSSPSRPVIHQPKEEIKAPPVVVAKKIPEPTHLLNELSQLQAEADPRLAALDPRAERTTLNPRVSGWITRTQNLLHSLVVEYGLEHPQSAEVLAELQEVAAQAGAISNELTNYRLASQVNQVAYGIQRRVSVWRALQNALDETSIGLMQPRDSDQARISMLRVLDRVEQDLAQIETGDYWGRFLLLDKLRTWVNSEARNPTEDGAMMRNVLARLRWPTLNASQRRFLSQPIFNELAAHVVVWGQHPQDYRQLLQDMEAIEQDTISRDRAKVAAASQILRLSDDPGQQQVAAAIETHYRNANLRLSVSAELIERFMPEPQYQARPVRQRILGADTAGDSAVRTNLSLRLIPDSTAWNVGIGVASEMQSLTRSSKGPAVFHNSSKAIINSGRYLRIHADGYEVSSHPTNVRSQDYLRKMSTDYDGMPVIGDFVRVLAREQFNQKRGLAKRITQRIIADEADAELDKRLRESLYKAETELADRLVGPLNRLSLNPTVISMQTSEDRLSIRYRVANESQLGAFTSRPRAPANSLMSLQIHESSLNNAIEQIGLSGKSWTLPELYERLQQVFENISWEIPDDVPLDLQIRFAETRPATVHMEDGKLRLTLRIAELNQPGKLKIERFLVTSTYVPAASGLSAELVRDGVVEIQTSGSRRDRIPLRFIFAKIFVARPQIPLISPAWVSDPRAEGLAVSQLEIRNGWLAAAISAVTNTRLPENVATLPEASVAR